jgi:hypothetical protein
MAWVNQHMANLVERLYFGKGHGGMTYGGKGLGLTASSGKGKAKGKGGIGKGMQCGCCGKANHTKESCMHSWKTCTQCGKVGHLKQACTSPTKSLRASAPCTRCTSTMHVTKDCPHTDKECNWCGKTGHLKAACTNTEGKQKEASQPAGADGKATYDAAVEEDEYGKRCMKCKAWSVLSGKSCLSCGTRWPKDTTAEAAEVVPKHLKPSKVLEELSERIGPANAGDDMRDEPMVYQCPKKQEEAAAARVTLMEKIKNLEGYDDCKAQLKAAREQLARLPKQNLAQPLKDAAAIASQRSALAEQYMTKKNSWENDLKMLQEEGCEEKRVEENELREAADRYRRHKEGIERDFVIRAKLIKDKEEKKTVMIAQLEAEHEEELKRLEEMTKRVGANHANVEHQEQQQKPQQQQEQQQGQPQQQESTKEQMRNGIKQLSQEGTPDEQVERVVAYMMRFMNQGQAKSTIIEQQGEATPGEQNALVLTLLPSKEVRRVREGSPGKEREKSRSPRGERAGEF